MNVHAYSNWLHACINARVTSLTLAAPGVGKTHIVRQLARQLDRPLVVIEGAYVSDEVALQGLPFAVDGKTAWLPPAQMVVPDNALLFIDEITSSPAQHLLYQVLLEKRIDTFTFPAGVDIIAAGNREEDAGSRWAMSPVVGNRCAVNQEFAGPNAAEWVDWALKHQLHPAIVAGIRFYPQWLHQYNPEDVRNPTPRAWHTASKLAYHMPVYTALQTAVGTPAADAMEVVIAHHRNMINPEDILAGHAGVPKDTMVGFITLANVNAFTSDTTTVAQARHLIEFVHKSLQKHGESMASVAMSALARIPHLNKMPEYKQFVTVYSRYL